MKYLPGWLFCLFFVPELKGETALYHITGTFTGNTISGFIMVGTIKARIQNNAFEVFGRLENARFEYIKTADSDSVGIWLTGGTYTLELEELPGTKNNPANKLLHIRFVAAPEAAGQFESFTGYREKLKGLLREQQVTTDSANSLYTKSVLDFSGIKNNPGLLLELLSQQPAPPVSAAVLHLMDSIKFVMLDHVQQLRRSQLRIGNKMENFTAQKSDGTPFELYRVRAKYILIDFWASWCVPCRSENKRWRNLYNSYQAGVFSIISISLDHSKLSFQKAVKEDGMNWVSLFDGKAWSGELPVKYKLASIPFSILLNEKFEVLGAALSPAMVEKIIQK